LGELLGNQLPKKVPLMVVLLVAFVLGLSVTLAEPAIGVLGTLAALIQPDQAPYLFLLLNNWNIGLMMTVGVGVGIAAVLGILRFTKGWSLKPIIFITTIGTIGLTCYLNWIDDRLRTVVGLAWDCGAVTTGPVTVPIILSIGIGVISHKQSLDPSIQLSPLSGFGIVTLASLYPIVTVEILACIAFWLYPGDSIYEKVASSAGVEDGWWQVSPVVELINAVRAIAPLVILLLLILKFVAKEKLPRVYLFGPDLKDDGDKHSIDSNDSAENAKKPNMYVGTAMESTLRETGKGIGHYVQNPMAGDVQGNYKRFEDSNGNDEEESIEMVPTGEKPNHDTDTDNNNNNGKEHVEEEAGPLEIVPIDDDTTQQVHYDLGVGEDSMRRPIPKRKGTESQQVGRFARNKIFFLGILCCQLGMILFNWGLTYGLSALGKSAGSMLPGAYLELESMPGSPAFGYETGLIIVLAFGWILGFLATIAEPALNILGEKVAHLTGGSFSKNLLIYSVSFGVATGIVLGLLKIIFPQLLLIYLIFAGYAIALVLTFFSSEDFVNVAWDSAGVTTGPVTVPFVLTLGLSLGQATHATDGFGILTMASVGPIISVLTSGLVIRLYSWTQGTLTRRYK